MDNKAREVLSVIRECLAADRFIMLPHFTQRMDERGLVWADVLAVLDDPDVVRDVGCDRFDRPKWLVSGRAADGASVEIVCVLDADELGNVTVFISLYWDGDRE